MLTRYVKGTVIVCGRGRCGGDVINGGGGSGGGGGGSGGSMGMFEQ